MKNINTKGVLVVLLGILCVLSSCEKPVELTDHEVFFKIGNEYAFRFGDITLYDSSTHIIYFKDSQSEFREFLQDRFAFFDKGDTIYSGIFNPGYSTKQRGWGLGLSLAKRIIEEFHKGHIYVRHSEMGKGSCIRIVMNKDPR